MDWNIIIKMLETGGPVAVIAGVMIWHSIQQSNKLVQIVETNTKAMTEMRDMIARLIDKMK